MKRTTTALIALTLAALPSAALAQGLQDFAIYAGNQVTFSSSMNVFNAPLGLVGSSGNISFAPATIRGTTFQAAGSMLNNPSFLTANSLTFNGNVQVNGLSTISGDINAGGPATSAATANGNTTAAGNITLSGTANNLFSNSSINLATFGNVTGNATAAQTSPSLRIPPSPGCRHLRRLPLHRHLLLHRRPHHPRHLHHHTRLLYASPHHPRYLHHRRTRRRHRLRHHHRPRPRLLRQPLHQQRHP